MNQRHEHELSPLLAEHVAAVEPVPSEALNAAQDRLQLRLRAARPKPGTRYPLRWAAAAMLALVVSTALVLPLFSDSGAAFAAARHHFRNFKTLSMRIEQRMDGALLQTTQVLINDQGQVRTDVDAQLSIIVDPLRGDLLTLLHDSKQAMRMPLPVAVPVRGGTNTPGLEWLDEVRNFQGRAKRLDQPRLIDGHEASGWKLDIGGSSFVLWIDQQGLPLAMEQQAGGSLELLYQFEFDAVIAAQVWTTDAPPGYTLVEGGPDQD